MNGPDHLVVDASVGVMWVLPEPDRERARSLLERARSGDAILLAPHIYVGEVANVVWKHCRLLNTLSEEQARQAMEELLYVLPVLVPGEQLVRQSLELALAFRRPVYDCFYVALAIREAGTLVTADRRLANVFGPATQRVIHLDDLATLD